MIRIKLEFSNEIPLLNSIFRRSWFLVEENMLTVSDLIRAIDKKFVDRTHLSLIQLNSKMDGFSIQPDQVRV